MSDALFSGTITNVLAGEVITKIEIAWLLSGTDVTADDAVTAGRSLTWNSPADDAQMAAFRGAGQIAAVGALVGGATYTPAIRVTKRKADTSILTGVWSTGSGAAASGNIAYFNTGTVDTGFAAKTTGAGASVTSNSPTGQATIYTPGNNNGESAFVIYDTVLPANKVYTLESVFSYASTPSSRSCTPFALVDSAAAPVGSTSPVFPISFDVSNNGNVSMFSYKDASNTPHYFSSATGLWNGGAWVSGAMVVGTSYRVVLESDATQWRLLLYVGGLETPARVTPYVLWANTKPIVNGFWFGAGNFYTNYTGCTMYIDTMKVTL